MPKKMRGLLAGLLLGLTLGAEQARQPKIELKVLHDIEKLTGLPGKDYNGMMFAGGVKQSGMSSWVARVCTRECINPPYTSAVIVGDVAVTENSTWSWSNASQLRVEHDTKGRVIGVEDPRLDVVAGKRFILANANVELPGKTCAGDEQELLRRQVFVAVDPEAGASQCTIDVEEPGFDHCQPQKNWAPLVPESSERVFFVYSLMPFQVMSLDTSSCKARLTKQAKLQSPDFSTVRSGTRYVLGMDVEEGRIHWSVAHTPPLAYKAVLTAILVRDSDDFELLGTSCGIDIAGLLAPDELFAYPNSILQYDAMNDEAEVTFHVDDTKNRLAILQGVRNWLVSVYQTWQKQGTSTCQAEPEIFFRHLQSSNLTRSTNGTDSTNITSSTTTTPASTPTSTTASDANDTNASIYEALRLLNPSTLNLTIYWNCVATNYTYLSQFGAFQKDDESYLRCQDDKHLLYERSCLHNLLVASNCVDGTWECGANWLHNQDHAVSWIHNTARIFPQCFTDYDATDHYELTWDCGDNCDLPCSYPKQFCTTVMKSYNSTECKMECAEDSKGSRRLRQGVHDMTLEFGSFIVTAAPSTSPSDGNGDVSSSTSAPPTSTPETPSTPAPPEPTPAPTPAPTPEPAPAPTPAPTPEPTPAPTPTTLVKKTIEAKGSVKMTVPDAAEFCADNKTEPSFNSAMKGSLPETSDAQVTSKCEVDGRRRLTAGSEGESVTFEYTIKVELIGDNATDEAASAMKMQALLDETSKIAEAKVAFQDDFMAAIRKMAEEKGETVPDWVSQIVVAEIKPPETISVVDSSGVQLDTFTREELRKVIADAANATTSTTVPVTLTEDGVDNGAVRHYQRPMITSLLLLFAAAHLG